MFEIPSVCAASPGRRDKLELVAKMFSVSAAGLSANKHVLTATIALNALLCAQLAAVGAAVALAAANGAVQRVEGVRAIGGEDTCVDAGGAAVPCCEWQVGLGLCPQADIPPLTAALATLHHLLPEREACSRSLQSAPAENV